MTYAQNRNARIAYHELIVVNAQLDAMFYRYMNTSDMPDEVFDAIMALQGATKRAIGDVKPLIGEGQDIYNEVF